MSGVIAFLFLTIFVISKLASASQENRAKRREDAAAPAKRNAPIRTVGTQRREMMRNVEQWRRAKEQQDDAEQLHSIHMDSCEGKLNSLKTLYEAGILEKHEYEQRVARVKAKHER